jgi:hypothetical protein
MIIIFMYELYFYQSDGVEYESINIEFLNLLNASIQNHHLVTDDE